VSREIASDATPLRIPRAPRLEQPPALVLGTGITALGVVRALGRAGLPLHAASADAGFVRASRWYRPPPAGRALADPTLLEPWLRALPLDQAVLIPCSDHDVLAIASLPPDLAERFPSSQADPEVLEDLLDKDRLRALLARHGVPHPRTVTVRGDELPPEDAMDWDRVFVKPRDSQEFNRRVRAKALRPEGRVALRRTLAWLAHEGLPVVLQEYVPGPPTNHVFLDGFVDAAGVMRACLARRRLRMSSPRFGNSCATLSVPLDEVRPAVEDLERLLAGIRYRGPFDAEFKQDERTGVFHLLEINVRPWWQIELAALCGVDVVPMIYRDALGQPVADTPEYRTGVEWILPYHDAAACAALVRSGALGLRAWVASWLRARWGGFAWDDPLPGPAAGLELVRRRSRGRARAAAAGPGPG